MTDDIRQAIDADAVLEALRRTENEERDRAWLVHRLRLLDVDATAGTSTQQLVDMLNERRRLVAADIGSSFYALRADGSLVFEVL